MFMYVIRRFSLIRLSLCFAISVMAIGMAPAHHILGIPHYAYDEDYPQTPVTVPKEYEALYGNNGNRGVNE